MKEELYKLEDLEREYPDEWVAGEVVERDEDGMPVKVKLIVHHTDKGKVFEKIKSRSEVILLYTGDVTEEERGYIL